MTPDEIRAAISADANLVAMAHAQPCNSQGLATALSAGRTKAASTKVISARGVAGKFASGPVSSEIALLKLEGARDAMLASSDPATHAFGSLLRRQLTFLAGEGLDFGDPTLRAQLDQLGALGVLTSDEVAHFKALANDPDPVNELDVRRAIFADNGAYLV